MGDLDLIDKYVVTEPCSHCGATGNCRCAVCRQKAESLALALAPRASRMDWEFAEGNQARMNALYQGQKQADRFRKSAAKNRMCQKCMGKKQVEKVDIDRLNRELQSGEITETKKMAILEKLGDMAPGLFRYGM